jgi:CubicO group peptidase (beta-lactamase class C family)
MLKRLAMLGLLLPAMAWGGEPAGAGPAPGERALLDRDVPGIIAQAGVPSVSIAQIKGGRVVLTAAYGAQQAGVPATPATLYNIASLTKPITAEVILRAASRGEVSLDEAMYRVWTDPDIAGDERRKLLTLRLVLSHRSGFPNWRDHKTGLAFERAPGEGWGYSGEGYVYAAKFTETKIGRPFEDLAQAYLFEPAGMTSTAYTQKPWYDGRIAIPTDASGKSLAPELTHRYIAADLVYTTAGDYAAFMTQVLRDRDLTPALAVARSQIAADTWAADCAGAKAAACPRREGFGLGWLVLDFGEAKLLMHTGKDAGVFTFAYLDPATGDGAVILTNSDKGGNIVIPILERLGARAAFVRYLKSEAS